MKFSLLGLLATTLLCAQPQSVPPIPGTLPAPPPAAPQTPVSPDAVVAEIGAKKYTAAEIDKLLAGFPPSIQQAVRAQPARGLLQLFMLKHLAAEAEKNGLDKKSPFKEGLEYSRLNLLTQAELQTHKYDIQVPLDEEQKFYDANPERFRQARVRVIYVEFATSPAAPGADPKKARTEAEAKARVEDLRKQALAGADFGKLAKENSDDKVSAGHEGDYGLIQRTSAYPDSIKNTVFSLKPGEISQPVREARGFYLIRLEEFRAQPFAEVKSDLFEEMKQNRFNAWVKGIESQYVVKIENPAYFSNRPATPLQLQPVR